MVATASMIFSIKILVGQIYLTSKLDGAPFPFIKWAKGKTVFFDDVIFTDFLFCITNIFITLCIYYFVGAENVDGSAELKAEKGLR